jgi:hypothetical protein
MKTTKKKVASKKPITTTGLRPDVTRAIQIHMIFDGVGTTGWVHTHGMWEVFQLPDLEIVGVSPLFLMTAAGGMLNHIAQYMVDGKLGVAGAKPVAVGQSMGMGHGVFVKFELSTPLHPNDADEIAGHFSSPRWRAVPVPEQFKCAGCDNHDKHDQMVKQ